MQWWRRMVFSIAAGNTDDYLRTHGFLFEARGWRLAPACDMNPNPDTQGALSLGIGADGATVDSSTALRVARDFHLAPPEADAALARIRESVSNRRAVAASAGIPPRPIECFRPAFMTCPPLNGRRPRGRTGTGGSPQPSAWGVSPSDAAA